jgi:hypothetical protein
MYVSVAIVMFRSMTVHIMMMQYKLIIFDDIALLMCDSSSTIAYVLFTLQLDECS